MQHMLHSNLCVLQESLNYSFFRFILTTDLQSCCHKVTGGISRESTLQESQIHPRDLQGRCLGLHSCDSAGSMWW